jgi:hypothetical protein
MFDLVAALRFKLFTTALQENSHYGHYIIMRNRSFHFRRVGFVEIMAPGFSRPALEQLLPTMDLPETGWGWGLDPLRAKLLDYQDLGILDATPVLHPRPAGRPRDAQLHRRLSDENDRILAQYDCPSKMVTFAGIAPDLTDMELSPEELLLKLVQGWDYLIARDPKVLRWISEHQDPLFDWAPYPVLGAPSSPPL